VRGEALGRGHKTGQIRNYREQMAAYSLACMDAHWESAWTAHVVYVDQKVVRSYEFTREQAERIVGDVIGMATSPLARPTPCQYCDWCANKTSAPRLCCKAKQPWPTSTQPMATR
jgi:hypothetical protein